MPITHTPPTGDQLADWLDTEGMVTVWSCADRVQTGSAFHHAVTELGKVNRGAYTIRRANGDAAVLSVNGAKILFRDRSLPGSHRGILADRLIIGNADVIGEGERLDLLPILDRAQDGGHLIELGRW